MLTRFNTTEPVQSSPDKHAILHVFYPVPDPLRSHEEWERCVHDDLEGLTPAELMLERSRVFWRLTFDDLPHPWLLERLDAIDVRLRDVA